MENLWPEYINNLEKLETPKNILEEQSEFLSNATVGLIYASVDDRTDISSDPTFIYEFNIRGKYLNNYKFTAFTITHEIAIYPLTIEFDEDIASEVGADSFLCELEVNTPENLRNVLIAVFKSKKMENVMRSIKSLSN
ncbi:hypothetical protein ACOV1W_03940 [Paraclostridium bifermentans]|uniref:hypothetical protein n=1 Tax=Paraclostridium bifermentans TaxID=1490 RepID=UPI003D287048